MLPVLRARITQVRGKAVTLDTVEDVRRGSLAREYRDMPPAARGTSGWSPGASGIRHRPPGPEISIEESIRERFGIGVGDEVRFILGQPIVARVTSVREVNWRDSRAGGFMFVFRPGCSRRRPTASSRRHAARRTSRREPGCSGTRGAVLERVGDRHPRGARDRSGRHRERDAGHRGCRRRNAVHGRAHSRGRGGDDEVRRVYEAAILKTLGASSRVVGAVLLVEYGLLGLLAGTIGAAGGAVLSWAVSRP